MLSTLIYLLIVALVFGAVWYVIGLLPIAEPFGRIVRIIVAVIFAIWVLNVLLGLLGVWDPVLAPGPTRLAPLP